MSVKLLSRNKQHDLSSLQLRGVMLLCWSHYKCFVLLAGFTQGKCNYSAVLGGGLFSLDGYKVRNVWTLLVCGVCWFSVSSGQLLTPVKTAIWRVFFHLSTYHQLIHTVPCRAFLVPFTLLHTQTWSGLFMPCINTYITLHAMAADGHL